eukprot:749337-Hanusia_phi.AAC.5
MWIEESVLKRDSSSSASEGEVSLGDKNSLQGKILRNNVKFRYLLPSCGALSGGGDDCDRGDDDGGGGVCDDGGGDGHLDAHELPPALYGLLNYDTNGDGRISAAEYLGALRQVQLEMSLDHQ